MTVDNSGFFEALEMSEFALFFNSHRWFLCSSEDLYRSESVPFLIITDHSTICITS